KLPDPLRDAVIFLTALHDLGKISDSFRNMLRDGTRQYRHHWEMTEVLLDRHDAAMAEILGLRDFQRHALYACVAGHHGRPPSGPLDDFRLDFHIGAQAISDADDVIRLFAALWPGASLAGLDKGRLRALEWWLPGFI